ncbi:MAG: hypothetical protein DCC58_21125 [Chloroflexi bacterium]|nr:MAG: hypothetical protein DCC58_21125 [Chloroflexota bacterium]
MLSAPRRPSAIRAELPTYPPVRLCGATSLIPALGSCSVYVTVTSVSLGTHTLNTGPLTTPIALNTVGASAQLSVLAQPSSVAVMSSANPSTFGQNVTFTATVTGGGPIPTGAVTFSDAAIPICSNVALNGSGQAACSTSALSVGAHTINVAYVGNGYYAASSGSLAGGQVVNPAPTATMTTLATSNPSVVAGALFTLTATVTGNAPTGTVGFTDGTNLLTGCAAVSLAGAGNARTALCAVSALPAGTYTLAANYSGDPSNLPSSGTVGQTVVAACVGFIDLAATSPFCPSVEWLKNRAITTGCTATELPHKCRQPSRDGGVHEAAWWGTHSYPAMDAAVTGFHRSRRPDPRLRNHRLPGGRIPASGLCRLRLCGQSSWGSRFLGRGARHI